MCKVSFLPNGQWELKKYDEKSFSHIHDTHTTIPSGEHTVEVHPHVDHLYNIKGQIQESGKDKLKVAHLKQAGFDKKFLNQHVPKDAKGWVSADMIDKHIEGLPRQKVNIKVAPYGMQAQQHRPGEQQVISVHLHDDTINNMSDNVKNHWDNIYGNQHNLFNYDGYEYDNPDVKGDAMDNDMSTQVGWARIDPKGHHWHVDEIQSDFNHPNKLINGNRSSWRDEQEGEYDFDTESGEIIPNSKYHERIRTTENEIKNTKSELHGILSHGHDDPQHMIHSAVNQLARKYNVQSMSMDTPKDQARQSGIALPDKDGGNIITNAIGKVGIDNMKALAEAMHFSHQDDWDTHFDEHTDKADLTDDQKTALKGWVDHNIGLGMTEFDHAAHEKDADSYEQQRQEESDQMAEDIETDYILRQERKDKSSPLPVHQINTYNKRPKKLGMKLKDKDKVLGEHPHDKTEQVQYHKLHKTLLRLREALKKC